MTTATKGTEMRTIDMNTPEGMFDHLTTLPTENLRKIEARPVFNAESTLMVTTAAAILIIRGE